MPSIDLQCRFGPIGLTQHVSRECLSLDGVSHVAIAQYVVRWLLYAIIVDIGRSLEDIMFRLDSSRLRSAAMYTRSDALDSHATASSAKNLSVASMQMSSACNARVQANISSAARVYL